MPVPPGRPITHQLFHMLRREHGTEAKWAPVLDKRRCYGTTDRHEPLLPLMSLIASDTHTHNDKLVMAINVAYS